jgi:hypothetical protein
MLRQSTFKNRDRDTAQAMVMTGNALEAIIGEDLFVALMDKIDDAHMAAA